MDRLSQKERREETNEGSLTPEGRKEKGKMAILSRQ
jgi:hypothetical protein